MRYRRAFGCPVAVGFLLGCGQPPKPFQPSGSPPPQSKVFRRFTIDSVKEQGTYIRVAGSTDLPNGAYVKADVTFRDDLLEPISKANNGWSAIKNGRWHVDLDAPVAPKFYRESHRVTVWGELDAKHGTVDKSISGTEDDGTFQTEKTVRIDRGPSSPWTPTLPRLSDYPVNSAGRAVAEFIGDWKRHDWRDMARRVDRGSSADIAKRFQTWELRESRIGEVNVGADPEAPVDNAQVTVHVRTSLGDMDLLWTLTKPAPRTRWDVDLEDVIPTSSK